MKIRQERLEVYNKMGYHLELLDSSKYIYTIFEKNFKEGDEILSINDIQIANYDDIDKAKFLYKGKKVNVTILVISLIVDIL
jgi:hypothetical protein